MAKCLHYLTGDVSSFFFSLSFLYSVLPMNHSTYFLKCHLIYYFKRSILLFLKKMKTFIVNNVFKEKGCCGST